MSTKPIALVLLDDAVSHLRTTLRKHKDTVPPSLAGQICGLLSHWGRQRLRRQEVIHPGMERMAEWGHCTDRQARTNRRTLEHWGFLEPTDYRKGGRRATRFRVHVGPLIQALVLLDVNPSPSLIEKLREVQKLAGNPEVNPEVRGARKAAKNPEATSAGIQGYTGKRPPARRSKASQDLETMLTALTDGRLH